MAVTSTSVRIFGAAAALLTLPGLAQAQAAAGGNGQLIQMLIMFGGIGLVMYLFMIRPQQRRAREQREMIEASVAGDELMLTSGFKVKLKHKDEQFFRVEIAPDLVAEVDPSAVTMNRTALEKRANDAKAKAEERDAKKKARNKNN